MSHSAYSVLGIFEEDVIKIEDDMPEKPSSEANLAHVLFEVGPPMPNVLVLHLPESHTMTAQSPKDISEEDLILSQPKATERNIWQTSNIKMQPSKIDFGPTSKSKKQSGDISGLVTIPTLTVTEENPTHTVEKVNARVSSRKHLINDEVKS